MRARIGWCRLVGSIGVWAFAAVAQANVLVNPGFESGLSPWTGAPNPPVGSTIVQADHVFAGNAAAEFTVGSTPASGSTMLLQSFPVQQQLTGLSFWYRMDAAAAASMRLDLALEGPGGGPFIAVPSIQANTWVQYIAPPSALVTPNRSALRIYAITQQGGPMPSGARIWIDDVVVTGVPTPGVLAPVTAAIGWVSGRRRRLTPARSR